MKRYKTIIKYTCPRCGWAGEDCEADSKYETALYPDLIEWTNHEACPVCVEGDDPEESIFLDVEIIKEELKDNKDFPHK